MRIWEHCSRHTQSSPHHLKPSTSYRTHRMKTASLTSVRIVIVYTAATVYTAVPVYTAVSVYTAAPSYTTVPVCATFLVICATLSLCIVTDPLEIVSTAMKNCSFLRGGYVTANITSAVSLLYLSVSWLCVLNQPRSPMAI